MTLYTMAVAPFIEFGFMRRALVACLALAISCGPLGTLLVLRRMSLVGDSMSHALLPGAALGFVLAGFSLAAMSVGAFLLGLTVALVAGVVSRTTAQKEDASFAAFYLIALAAGVMLVSTHGSSIDLLHLLFGSILAVDDTALLSVATVSSVTLVTLALIHRPLMVECFDPGFLHSVGGHGACYHLLFLVLVVMNLVSGFVALGTLMAVGLMMLPAIAARFWVADIWRLSVLAAAIAAASGLGGLLISFHANVPSGPAIVLLAGAIFVASLLLGQRDGVLVRLRCTNLRPEG